VDHGKVNEAGNEACEGGKGARQERGTSRGLAGQKSTDFANTLKNERYFEDVGGKEPMGEKGPGGAGKAVQHDSGSVTENFSKKGV